MDNQNTQNLNNLTENQPPIEPQPTPKAKTDKLGVISVILAVLLPPVGFILGLIGASKAKKESRSPVMSRIGWILGLIISVPLIIFLSLLSLLTSVGNSIDHGEAGGNPAKVIPAYTKAADKMAIIVTQNVSGSKMYAIQSLAPDTSKRNDVRRLYCFITNNSPNVISQTLNGFLQDKSAAWQPPDTPDNQYSFVDYPDNSGFINYYKSALNNSGAINIELITDPNAYDGKPIKTDNPAYYAEGVADILISLPGQNNQCANLAKQKGLKASNKYILAITLDFDDYQPQLPF